MVQNGIAQVVDPGGREALRLFTEDSEVLVSLLGAQVLTWRKAGHDVLWTASNAEHAPGKPVRGGIPIVFPWFGDHPTDPTLPAHGFARNLAFCVAATTPDPSLTLELTDTEASLAMWPHSFRLQFVIELCDHLRIEWKIQNTGTEPFECEEALHSYYTVGSVHSAEVRGLLGVAYTEHAAAPEPGWDNHQPLRFRAETDRIFQGVPSQIAIDAPEVARTIRLATEQADSAIVWNPWPAKTARLSQMAADDWERFVCVESANVREGAVRLAPGDSHDMSLTISLSDQVV